MSKYVKNLVTRQLASRLEGVDNCLLVNVVGMNANATVSLRRQLRERNIQLVVVRNSLARRATSGTPLAPAFDGAQQSLAVVWGGEDFVSLVKEITQLARHDAFKAFEARGGVMEGERLSPERIQDISKWPNRQEQLAILLGQILSPGAQLSAQLLGPGGQLASQIEQIAEGSGQVEEAAGQAGAAGESDEAAPAESGAAESGAAESGADQSGADQSGADQSGAAKPEA